MQIISGKNITKSFGSDRLLTQVLKGIDIEIFSGEFVAIMGKSGAGKSTLLYQLSALDKPTSGEIYIDNQNILDFNETELVNFRLYTLGYIFQDYALIPDLTAEENVVVPLLMRGEDWYTAKQTALKALDDVDLPGKYHHLPSELSGGEQQRVAVARAIAGKPKIVFADEPTANLDSTSGRAIIDLLATLHKTGQTIVMVTHEAEYTNHCDRIINLKDGRIIGESTTQNTTETTPLNPSSVTDEFNSNLSQ
ncbi:MAG: ABC transporter ATP-binding protein [Candidatus Paceibacterota bacterium]